MVSIHAKINNQWMRFLEISQDDIARLSLKPLKWLRFVAFVSLGARGRLHYDALGDSPVTDEYCETVLQASDLAEGYYFIPEGSCHFIDPDALNDHTSLSGGSSRRLASFPASIATRDEHRCVITGSPGYQAAHIIPRSKGDMYIQSIILHGRGSLYEDQQPDLNINSAENRMLLRSDVHVRFGKGHSGFLKTPNFALNPIDIPRVETGDMPASRITFQHLEPYSDSEIDQVRQRDVRVNWPTADNAPSTMLLDYAYGAAALNRWASADVVNLLKSIHDDTTRRNKKSSHPTTHHHEGDDGIKPLHSTSGASSCYNLCSHHAGTIDRMEHRDSQPSMETGFQLAMLLGGYDPGASLDTISREQEEEAKRRSVQIARGKVEEWLGKGESLIVVER